MRRKLQGGSRLEAGAFQPGPEPANNRLPLQIMRMLFTPLPGEDWFASALSDPGAIVQSAEDIQRLGDIAVGFILWGSLGQLFAGVEDEQHARSENFQRIDILHHGVDKDWMARGAFTGRQTGVGNQRVELVEQAVGLVKQGIRAAPALVIRAKLLGQRPQAAGPGAGAGNRG